MRIWMIVMMVAGLCPAAPEPKPAAATPEVAAMPVVPPAVDDAIPPAVKALAAPTPMEFFNGLTMAVTAATPEAQAAVLQGLNHLHGGWEFEATRHFAVAMQLDPDCLLAHWGMVMSLLQPTPETGKARQAAAERMLILLNRGLGTELERSYVYGLSKYLEEGPVSAASAFGKVTRQFPNDVQAAIFAAWFGRGGYDDMGEATPDEERAEDAVKALLKVRPDSPLLLNTLLVMRAEALDLTPELERARKLCEMVPDYAPYFHLLGHYEWRCGNHRAAVSAFGRATSLYSQWMKANKASVAECPEWTKAECYRVVALASKGEFDTAYTAAEQLAAVPLPEKRTSSAGVRMMLWEGKTLTARLLMRRGLPGDAAKAMAALPKPLSLKPYHNECLAYWWIDGLRIVLESRRLLDEGKSEEARQAADALDFHGAQMAKAQGVAYAGGERSAWQRAFPALQVLASENRGRLALAAEAARRGSAYNWFSSAAEKQHPASVMYPPVILSPMRTRLGYFRLMEKKPAEAVATFTEALRDFPNDVEALQGLQRAQTAANQPAEAAKTGDLIKRLQQP